MKDKKEEETEELHEIPQKVKIFMKLRGYSLKEKREKEDIIDFLASRSKTGEKVLMRLVVASKLKSGRIGVREVRKMKKMLEEAAVDQQILIGGGFTYASRKEAMGDHIELISTDSLPSFDIFKHELVPKHEILTKEEVEELQERYRIAPYQIPRIKVSDPAARMIGARPGDIVRIIRKSPTAGRSVAYRYVI
ncbi:MAG: DNA-directed RNA polymerase subunit H [Candidatus Bathyarchaeota archaeon]|nr:MAG: DNA-directed RNA polymerase subunit H [Candidatus Bathyarchaeota archaeon]